MLAMFQGCNCCCDIQWVTERRQCRSVVWRFSSHVWERSLRFLTSVLISLYASSVQLTYCLTSSVCISLIRSKCMLSYLPHQQCITQNI